MIMNSNLLSLTCEFSASLYIKSSMYDLTRGSECSLACDLKRDSHNLPISNSPDNDTDADDLSPKTGKSSWMSCALEKDRTTRVKNKKNLFTITV